ncbi:MAG: hypothetical protein LBB23_00740 [Rickettsiales bacterium]|nr:hypothetical protein [Rickettsiales bacterium]
MSLIKKILFPAILVVAMTTAADAWQMETQRTLGSGEGANQNVLVKCTTSAGKTSGQTCALRRYAKCAKNASGKQVCNGWNQWSDIRNPGKGYSTWQSAATECCSAKGLK